MQVREATRLDAGDLVRMACAFINETQYAGRIGANPEQLLVLVDTLLARGLILVAESDAGIPIGMLALHVGPHPISGEMTATEVAWWIDREYRGGRCALEMLQVAKAWADVQGARIFQMIAPAGSPVGRLYARLGLTELETTWQVRF